MSNYTPKRFVYSNCFYIYTTFTLLFFVTAASAQYSRSIQSTPQAHLPLSDILSPDGSIKAGTTQGSFYAHGYRMVTKENGVPGFKKIASDPNDRNWDPSFTVAGVSGFGITAAANGDTLYVGGAFGTAGNIIASDIAAYNLTTNKWSSLDTTSSDHGVSGQVVSILVNGSDVYIGGSFISAGGVSANNIVDYNTSTRTWTALGSRTNNGVDNTVYVMTYFSGNLYVGGAFTHAGGSAANYVAKWDGTSWSALGSGVDADVYTLTINGQSLYVGGDFLDAGDDTANFIAKWDGINWSHVGTSATDVNNSVYSIVSAGNSLYIGGAFTKAGGTTVNGIARWNGTSWSPVGPGVAGGASQVKSLIWSGNNLYACGSFTTAGLLTVNNIVEIDTSADTYSALGTDTNAGTNDQIYWGTAADGILYIPGVFTSAGGTSAFGIASWDGTNWSSLGGSTNAPGGSTVYALAVSGSNVYVGGDFLNAGPVAANHIAVFNTSTSTWSSLGTGIANGVDDIVDAIAVSGSNVYVGGSFLHAGGDTANYIAMWDGTKWNTLGTSPNDGVDDPVLALATSGTDLYVGGIFSHAGGKSSSYVAEWNGTAWSALSTGVDSYVYAIAPGTEEIYFGGNFTHAGGSSANYIASWSGTTWSALGTPTNGVNARINALAAYGDTVFVGGNFVNAGGSPAHYLAKWNTHQWTVLGAGVSGDVYAIARNGEDLFIGGYFLTSGLVSANNVIMWSIADSVFSTLGDGTNGTVDAAVSTGEDNYFGGSFSIAGGKPSYTFARYNPNGIVAVKEKPPVASSFELLQNYPNPFNPTTTISYELPTNSIVTLKVYDILGREVATLVDGTQSPGEYSIKFDGSRFASGVYFYRLSAGNYTSIKKAVLMK